MKDRVLRCLFPVLIILSSVLPAAGQVASAPSENQSRMVYEAGAGFGGYYGTFGGKFSIGGNLWSVDLGLGLGPLADGVTVDVSPGVSIYFADASRALRPRVSLLVSTIGHTINVTEEFRSGSANVLYQEHFPGAGIQAGVNWGFGQKRRIGLDANLGYVYPFKGYSAVKRIKDDQVTSWRSRGFIIEDRLGLDTVGPIDYVSFSLGVGFTWGRSRASK